MKHVKNVTLALVASLSLAGIAHADDVTAAPATPSSQTFAATNILWRTTGPAKGTVTLTVPSEVAAKMTKGDEVPFFVEKSGSKSGGNAFTGKLKMNQDGTATITGKYKAGSPEEENRLVTETEVTVY